MEHEFGAVWHLSGVVEDPAPRLLSFSSEEPHGRRCPSQMEVVASVATLLNIVSNATNTKCKPNIIFHSFF